MPHPARGDRHHHNALLTEQQVIAIRQAYHTPCPHCGMTATTRALGRKYGVSYIAIYNIVTGRSYREAGGPVRASADAQTPPGGIMTNPEVAQARERARMTLNSHFFWGDGGQWDRAIDAMVAFATLTKEAPAEPAGEVVVSQNAVAGRLHWLWEEIDSRTEEGAYVTRKIQQLIEDLGGFHWGGSGATPKPEFLPALTPKPAQDVGVLVEAIRARKAIYEKKRNESDPFAENDCNRHERMQHAVEAFEHLLADIAALTTPSDRASGQGDRDAELLADIAAMMSEFVDNWPQPKKVSTALALIAKTMRTLLDPPKHSFWGAGEADCPRDIKAPNGELHTLRCKTCGIDNPRDNRCLNSPTPPSDVVPGEQERGE